MVAPESLLQVISLACLTALLLAGLYAGRLRRIALQDTTSETFRIANWVRWLHFAIATGAALFALYDARSTPVIVIAIEIPVAIGFGWAFAFCSRYFISIGKTEIVIGTIFGVRIIPLVAIANLKEMSARRSAAAIVAFDSNGRQLFMITDNVQDYMRASTLLRVSVPIDTRLRSVGK